MSKDIRTLKVRLYPNREQEKMLLDTLAQCAELYNSLLDYCKECHEKGEKHPSAYDMMMLLPQMKNEKPKMKTVYAQVLQNVCIRVSRAFDGFFRRVKEKKEEAGYPRYRSISRYDSFTYSQNGFILSKDHLILSPGKQKIRIRGFRKMDGKIKTCTIIRKGCSPNYRWEAAITFESEKRYADNITRIQKDRSIGIDMGLINLIVTSEGKEYPNGKEYIKAERQLSKILRKMSKYEKGTPERER